jgi:hypothetical protein
MDSLSYAVSSLKYVMPRMSRTRAAEHLQDEGVRARKQRTAPRRRELACIDALGKSLYCTAVRSRLSLCGRNIHAEDLAQVTRSSIPVRVISSM